MRRKIFLLISLLTITLLSACPTSTKPEKDRALGSEPNPSSSASKPETIDAELGTLDTRTPIHLNAMMAWHQKQRMMEHLESVQTIVKGLAANDFDLVEKAAKTLESSAEQTHECEMMSDQNATFLTMGTRLHTAADKIRPAAQAKDTQRVLSALEQTLVTCTQCHATFRQQRTP